MNEQVRDKYGDIWIRNEYGWSHGITQASTDWLQRFYGPLVVVENEDVTA